MAKKKTTKGRKKTRPDYSKIAFIVVLCFLSGAFTYGVLDLVFSKKENFAQISLPADKTQNLQIQNSQAKNSPNLQEKKTQNANLIKPKQDNKTKNEANLTILAENLPNLEQNKTFKTDDEDKNLSNLTLVQNEENSEVKVSNLPIKKPFSGHKPKLAIIMDDISEAGQIARIKKLPIAVTPSIFPPNAKNPHTPSLSKGFKAFSIHFPLEALNYSDKLKTLKTNASYEEIEQAVARLRSDFPNAKFINNHTGSKFTANAQAMNLLIRALYKYDFYFVDSRTIGKTAVRDAVYRFNMRYAYRDIFLDNIDTYDEVRARLKEAVQVAKKKGYAIAIGHPKKSTFGALANSSDILDEVEVVYLDEIYEYYK